MDQKDKDVMDRKKKAERGWIGEPPPPARDYVPGEEHKWRLMMGNGQFEQKANPSEG